MEDKKLFVAYSQVVINNEATFSWAVIPGNSRAHELIKLSAWMHRFEAIKTAFDMSRKEGYNTIILLEQNGRQEESFNINENVIDIMRKVALRWEEPFKEEKKKAVLVD